MAKHTLGPWKVVHDGACVLSADGTGVADCRTVDTQNALEERKANARLIATAPDLLDFLKRIVAGFEAGLVLLDPQATGLIAEARKWVAKAEGPSEG